MLVEDLLDLTLREVLENYCTVCNLECGYYYGVFKKDDIDELYEHYNVEEYTEAFYIDELISLEIIPSVKDEIRDYNKCITIMENLGISKK